MGIDPRRQVGMGNTPGNHPFTQLGYSVQSSSHAKEAIPVDTAKKFTGSLVDIVLPTGEEDRPRTGAVARIHFDSNKMNEQWGETWFRLSHDTRELLQQYGTQDAIRRGRLRVELSITGASPRTGTVKILGDGSQDNRDQDMEKTPVAAWADMSNGLQEKLTSPSGADERKIIRLDDASNAYIEIGRDHIKLAVGEKNFILLNSGGRTTQGYHNHQGPPTDTNFYGMFKPQNEFVGTFTMGLYSAPQYQIDPQLLKIIPAIISLAATLKVVNQL